MIDTLLRNSILPDSFVRFGIRRLLNARLRSEKKETPEAQQEHLMNLITQLKQSPIAVNTPDANAQHYEVPTDFFQKILGPNMKYSCCYWTDDTKDIADAEVAMLKLTCERAEIIDGQEILELGCGWGSLTFYMAKLYPDSRITAVSNSKTQKDHIDREANHRGIKNITVITADMNDFSVERKFDRIVSVEMFEHMRNYQRLMGKIATWLKDDGKLFIHIFTHKEFSYLFDVKDATDWMSNYFFTGGIMPADNLLLYFNDHLKLRHHWKVSGTHYQKTAEAWLINMDEHKKEIMPILEATYGRGHSKMWWAYWRIFFLSCAELWGFNRGEEWIVSHYVFTK